MNLHFLRQTKLKAGNRPFARFRAARAFTLLEVMIAVGILFMCLFAVLALTSNSLASARKLQLHKNMDAATYESQVYTIYSNTNQMDQDGEDDIDLGDDFPGVKCHVDWQDAKTNGLRDMRVVVTDSHGGQIENHFFLYKPEDRRGGGISRSLPHH
jgi:hypothetical protein